MSLDYIRKSPSGRNLTGFSGAAVLAVGYVSAGGPFVLTPGANIVLAQDVPAWPAGLSPANARLGILGNCRISQLADVAPDYSPIFLTINFSAVGGAENRWENVVRPVHTTTLTSEKTLSSQFLSAPGDPALSVGGAVSVQGLNPTADPPPSALECSLLWFITGV